MLHKITIVGSVHAGHWSPLYWRSMMQARLRTHMYSHDGFCITPDKIACAKVSGADNIAWRTKLHANRRRGAEAGVSPWPTACDVTVMSMYLLGGQWVGTEVPVIQCAGFPTWRHNGHNKLICFLKADFSQLYISVCGMFLTGILLASTGLFF